MDANTRWLSKAHAEFRKLRNGEVADNLRDQGIEYKTIWGLESYRLKEIASMLMEQIPDEAARQQLAESLWAEDVRESKMLATRLYPIALLSAERAAQWADDVRYTELADQLCMHLLSRLADAPQWIARWIEADSMHRYMALMLILRLDLTGYAEQATAIAADASQPMWLRAAAQRVATTEA